MSDFLHSSRSKSSIHGARTPLKLIQAPSSFIERVNKVTPIQIFENTRKYSEKLLESDRAYSPYISTRTDRLNGTLNKLGLRSKPKPFSKKKLKLELGIAKMWEILKSSKKEGFDKIRREGVNRENEITRKNSYEHDIKKLLEDTFQKYIPRVTQTSTTLTKCEKCGHVGLNFLTSSTKENFSPRFLDKIRQLLPDSGVRKSMSEVSTLPISDCYRDTCLISPFTDNYSSSLTNFSPDFCGNGKIQIPRLNISETTIVPKRPRYSEEVLKGSPVKRITELNVNAAVGKINSVFLTRVHRSFDMIFLARAFRQNHEHSLTFEFTLEESKISNESNEHSTLTGTFGETNRFFEISAIQKKKDESNSMDYTENWNTNKNLKSACKILFTRLDKLFYRRKVRGFYSLIDAMY